MQISEEYNSYCIVRSDGRECNDNLTAFSYWDFKMAYIYLLITFLLNLSFCFLAYFVDCVFTVLYLLTPLYMVSTTSDWDVEKVFCCNSYVAQSVYIILTQYCVLYIERAQHGFYPTTNTFSLLVIMSTYCLLTDILCLFYVYECAMFHFVFSSNTSARSVTCLLVLLQQTTSSRMTGL